MRNSQVNEELFSANYGRVPGALPSPAAVKPLSFSYASPAFSSSIGSSSPLQPGVDFNSPQTIHPQPQIQQLAYLQSLQKQQTNNDLQGSQHSHIPVHPGFIRQTNKDLPGSQHFHMPVQYPGFIGQTNNYLPSRQHSHMPVQYPGFFGQTNKDPSGSQSSHMPVQYPGFIRQTNKDPPRSQPSHLPVLYPGFIRQANKDPPGSQHPHMPVQYPGLINPQLKQYQNLQSNMGPSSSHHSQLPQQHLGLTKDQLESFRWQQYMETPWSNGTQLHLQHPSFTEHPLKRGGQLNQEPQAITPASIESHPQPSILHAPSTFNQDKSAGKHGQDVSEKPQPIPSSIPGNNLPKASYKGKEKVTSSSSDTQSVTSVMNELPDLGFPGNCGLLNNKYPFVPPREYYYPSLPSEFMQVLEGCSPPGAAIPNPYGETDEPMFDIPFFKQNRSTNLSGSVGNSNSLSLASNMKDLPSRKGKEVVNIKKRQPK